MTPAKQGVFTNIGKNFAETLQFEDLAVNNFFLFYYVLFCGKKSLIGVKCIFINVEEKTLKEKTFGRKSHSKFEGLKGGPFKHTKKNYLQNMFNFS